MSSILPVVVPKTEREEKGKRERQIVDGEVDQREEKEICDQVGHLVEACDQVGHLVEAGDQVGHCDQVGEHGDQGGESRVGGVVAASSEEKFVQGIGRTQSTAMSRTVELSPVSARGHSHMTSALGGVGGPQKADESNKIS